MVSNIFKRLGKQMSFSWILWVSVMAGFWTQANTCYAVYYSLCSWNEYILPPMVIMYDPSSSADVNCNVVVKERSRLNCGCTSLFDQPYLLHTTVWTQKKDFFSSLSSKDLFFHDQYQHHPEFLLFGIVNEVTSYTADSLKISSR